MPGPVWKTLCVTAVTSDPQCLEVGGEKGMRKETSFNADTSFCPRERIVRKQKPASVGADISHSMQFSHVTRSAQATDDQRSGVGRTDPGEGGGWAGACARWRDR